MKQRLLYSLMVTVMVHLISCAGFIEVPCDTTVGKEAGSKKYINSIDMEFVWIPPGTFRMGSPSNEPDRRENEKQHCVTLTKPYYMQTTEVTQEQWLLIMGT